MMIILSDDFAEHDLIGHAAYTDGLIEVIRTVESKGAFTMGIYGQWGSGKTSILRQMKKALENIKPDAGQPIITVWFNPWQFVAEEHLIIPFFHTLIASLEESADNAKADKIKNKLHRFLEKIAHVPLALAYGMEGELKIPLLMKAKFVASKSIDYQKKIGGKIDEENEPSVAKAIKKYESTYYKLIQLLRDATKDFDFKIVVFIDDLDRCLPEKAVELLEGMKVLLDLPKFIFVIGVARDVIEQGVRVRYRELYDLDKKHPQGALVNIEAKYLDKIIQFPFSLPSADPKKLKRNILMPQLDKLKVTKPYVDLIHEVLGSNPRTLKRFINAISFALHIARKKLKNNDFYPELIIKISLIGYLFPNLYRQLEKYPTHLIRLENIVKEIVEESVEKNYENEFIDSYTQKEKKTGLPLIDYWLEGGKINKLIPILKINSEMHEVGFKDKETVIKYVGFLAPTLQSEVNSKSKDDIDKDKSLDEYLKNRMVQIPAGNFNMGDEQVGQVKVTISNPFLIDKYPVTQTLYKKVMGKNPSYFRGEDLPVENISWFDAIEFCNELSKQSHLEPVYTINGRDVEIDYEKNGYRLPTEAEWEYACRGRDENANYGKLQDIAWYHNNSKNQTHEVGQKKPNSYGLYDMLGNVWEWCNDWFGKYNTQSCTDPIGPPKGTKRILRGGSWTNFEKLIRAENRYTAYPIIHDQRKGMRIVLPLKG